jgi:hypothetical protein
MAVFDSYYLPAISDGRVQRFALYTLTDLAERDDHCAHIYNKSLLYLVSNAFEARPRIPQLRPDGVPLLGMARFVAQHAAFNSLVSAGQATWVQSPNTVPVGSHGASTSCGHGGFDDDEATVTSTLAFVLGQSNAAASKAMAAMAAYDPKAGTKRIQALRAGLERAT